MRIFLCTFNGLSKSGPLYYIDAYVVYNSSSFPDDASSHGFSMNRARNKSFVSIERGERRMWRKMERSRKSGSVYDGKHVREREKQVIRRVETSNFSVVCV